MSFLDDLLAGGSDYRVVLDIGGAVFGPVDDSEEAMKRFQTVANRIRANDGLGYRLVERLTYKSSEYAQSYIDHLVINF